MRHTITIPKPCSEDWNKMTPTQKGAFCKSCEKEVIDFTHTSNIELSRKIKKGENMCGRFTANQLDTPLPSVERSTWKRNAAMLGFASVLALGTPLTAQEKEPAPIHIPQKPIIMGIIAPQPVFETVTIKGTIQGINATKQKAYISLVGTDIRTQTDLEGNFCLEIPEEHLKNNAALLVAALGFENLEIAVTSKTTFVTGTLQEEMYQIMGEIEILHEPSLIDKTKKLLHRK